MLFKPYPQIYQISLKYFEACESYAAHRVFNHAHDTTTHPDLHPNPMLSKISKGLGVMERSRSVSEQTDKKYP